MQRISGPRDDVRTAPAAVRRAPRVPPRPAPVLPRPTVLHRAVAVLAAMVLLLTLASAWRLWTGGIDVRGGSERQREVFAEAVGLFREAGLVLPDITVILVPDPRICGLSWGGHQRVGRYRDSWQGGTATVCTDRLETMVHELAHAWVEERVGSSDRLKFMLLRDVTTWRSPIEPWGERGTEHAAEILTWALLGFPSEEVRVAPRDRESLLEALAFLLEAGGSRSTVDDFPVSRAEGQASTVRPEPP